MRLLVTLAAIVTFPLIASAQPAKQVEVTNLPAVQDVNIVGGGMAPSRFQIVGFTVATYTGNLGGYFGATRKCQLEFPESRMCSSQEVQETTSIPAGLAGFAWVNGAPVSCGRWTSESFDDRGAVVSGETGLTSVIISAADGRRCANPAPLACCAPVP